ncbi:hypothetical protein [Salinibacterium sp. NYA9b]
MTFELTNMGKASAHDVLLSVKHRGQSDFEHLDYLTELKPSEPTVYSVSRVTGSSEREHGRNFPSGDFPDFEWDFVLTWREAPTLSRKRTKTLRLSQKSGELGELRGVFALKRRSKLFFDWLRLSFFALKP